MNPAKMKKMNMWKKMIILMKLMKLMKLMITLLKIIIKLQLLNAFQRLLLQKINNLNKEIKIMMKKKLILKIF